jgi:hypothetical protein
MDELREAISVRSGDRALVEMYLMKGTRIVEVCEGLVVHDDIDDLVRFTDYSVHEFLQVNGSLGLLSSVDLAKTCLTYLTFDVFSIWPHNHEGGLRNLKGQYAFGNHAAKFWDQYSRGPGNADG